MCTDTGLAALAAPVAARLRRQEEWAGQTVELETVDALSILMVCDNVVDTLLPDVGPARRMPLTNIGAAPHLLEAATLEEGKVVDVPLAQHGFSVLVAVTRGGCTHRLLFDCGVTPDGCVDNLRRLDQDPAALEAIVCSHGHFDHTTGLAGLVRTLGRVDLPVLIHPEFWTRRRLNLPGHPLELPTTSRRALEGAGFDIIENRQPSFLFHRSLLVTGEIDRSTEFERGFPIHQARRNGAWEPDPFILDDQALVAHVAGKGLVIVTGCGHAGIVNIVRYAQRLTGVEPVHAVLGGFHLSGPPFEPIIEPTCAALANLVPGVLPLSVLPVARLTRLLAEHPASS